MVSQFCTQNKKTATKTETETYLQAVEVGITCRMVLLTPLSLLVNRTQVTSQNLVCQLALLDTLVRLIDAFSVGITEAVGAQVLVSTSIPVPTNPLPMCVGVGTGHVGSDQLWCVRSMKACIGPDAINVRAVSGAQKNDLQTGKKTHVFHNIPVPVGVLIVASVIGEIPIFKPGEIIVHGGKRRIVFRARSAMSRMLHHIP
jgi:hypothetical protein